MTTRVVKQGEHICRIAREAGLADWRTVWHDGQNAELRAKRRNPNILAPGDSVFVPDPQARIEKRPTGRCHRFRRKTAELRIRLVLRDIQFRPVRDKACTLQVDGKKTRLTSDASGVVEVAIHPAAERGRLLVDDPRLPSVVEFEIGKLDPIDTVTGQKARLGNLGYFAGAIDRSDTPLFRSAVEEFQLEHLGRAEVDGQCGPKTQAKLQQVHGC